MGKNFRKIMTIVTALLFVLPIFLIAVSCKPVEERSEADVIPATLGTKEGLWLYKGNYRTRTDGTEEEKLMTSVTVNETEYGEDEFKIVEYAYARGTFEIFYIIQIGEDVRLYHYNYFTKTSSDLYDLPDKENPNGYQISVTNSLVYVSDENARYGVIFSRTAQLLYEDFYGTLNGDVVYRLNSQELVYFKNGVLHTASFGGKYLRIDSTYQYGNWFYVFGSSAFAVNLDTEEVLAFSAFDMDGNTFRVEDSYLTGGSYYVLARCVLNRSTDDEEDYYRFIRMTGAKAELVNDFGEVSYGVTMKIDGSTIYLTKGAKYSISVKYYAYDTKTGEFDTVSKKALEESKTTEAIQREQTNKRKEITVGGYTFFVTSIGYDADGVYYDKTCYYLIRKSGDFEEVMQYSLNGNDGYFFDDICEI